MATIKSFTDLQQSRKLAEILPLESADMSWVSIGLGKPFARTRPIKGDPEEFCACWSLAALLGVLPKQIHNNGLWWLQIDYIYNSVSYMGKDNSVLHYVLMDSDKSLVDACYEMILKLNELKML